MAYEKVPRPSTVYHLTQKGNHDSILDDGMIRRFNDTECWFCESLDKMKAYMEQTVMCKGKPYRTADGQLCHYSNFNSEAYILLKLAPIRQENAWYEKMYPGVKITPEVLAALRASDRQMRRFENELKTERFEADNEKQVARFIPSREDSYERLVEEDRLQFADEEMSVEDAVEYREMIRYLYQALAQLEVAEQALIRADFFLMKTEAECAKAAGISQPGYRKRRDRILRKLRKSLKECAPKDFQEILEKWL